MAKTADVHQAIWADPWFAELPPDAKLLYFWAITTPHGNLAGLFVAGRRLIEFDTGLTSSRFQKAREAVREKLHFDEPSGTVWVAGRVKRVRSKTPQIAKSIVKAVEECQVPEVRDAFMKKYGSEAWLADALTDSALPAVSVEPHRSSTSLAEAPSQSQSQGQPKNQQPNPRDAEWAEWLADFRKVTGHEHVSGSKEARRFFNARRSEGRSLADLKFATRGAHGDEHCRRNGYDRPETILRESRVERFIGLGKAATNGSARDTETKRKVLAGTG